MVCPAPVMLRALRRPSWPGRPPIDAVRRRAYGQSVFRAFARLALVALAAGLVASAAASAVVPKVTLTVVVNGDGAVVSHPAGISCPSVCKLHVRKGTHVVLAAKPDSGSQLSKWGSPCASSLTCAVTMTASKIVFVAFKTPVPPPLPPPPPPPPPAKSGHYSGTYSDGGKFDLDVSPSGPSVLNVLFDNNGHCADGGTIGGGQGYAPGPYTIAADGSFTGNKTFTFTNGDVEVTTISGKFASDGSAGGTANVSYTFGPGPDAGINCTSTGTWSAKPSS
jgi:hypothetical protein